MDFSSVFQGNVCNCIPHTEKDSRALICFWPFYLFIKMHSNDSAYEKSKKRRINRPKTTAHVFGTSQDVSPELMRHCYLPQEFKSWGVRMALWLRPCLPPLRIRDVILRSYVG